MEQRAQWSAPDWAAYSALYSISSVQSSLSTGYTNLGAMACMTCFRDGDKSFLHWVLEDLIYLKITAKDGPSAMRYELDPLIFLWWNIKKVLSIPFLTGEYSIVI